MLPKAPARKVVGNPSRNRCAQFPGDCRESPVACWKRRFQSRAQHPGENGYLTVAGDRNQQGMLAATEKRSYSANKDKKISDDRESGWHCGDGGRGVWIGPSLGA